MSNQEQIVKKDSPTRSILKAISWRIIASGTTFYHQFYYFHERLWTNITWGKYQQRKVWKKIYRNRHKEMHK